MAGERARAIAQAFAPQRFWGHRGDYYYALLKLRSDPLYPGVLDALRGSSAPLLDMGCGLGLLAHALRQDGQRMAYLGVDSDASKIQRAASAAERSMLRNVSFAPIDLLAALPAHQGNVAILDVLQYLPAAAQPGLLQRAAAMLGEDARLVIRMTVADGSRRSGVSRVADRAANLIGWMRSRPRDYLDVDAVLAHLQQAGLTVNLTPLYGNTPFNNWLLVARRG
ncbi:class I SAM-dependent methyltransferase [uncultured Stenotrophomonas sp.]|uniref:class I SAM-dependent methyltransferase n=1 Tax=uncultured Stenotrophomonas sp. TaxID=165438 RepID=UPI0025DF3C87|nr:class I SAM-dependent methyltransferase [uncultured Stenotrophomonas sp.]